MPVPRTNTVVLTGAERRRIIKALRGIENLAAGGARGTSGRSVSRYALGRVGSRARRNIRSTTPRRTGRLARSTRGKIERTRRGGRTQLWYRAGWRTDLIKRFQQGLAIEHGLKSRSFPARKIIQAALDATVGTDGSVLKRTWLAEFHRRVRALAAKANARARTRRR